MDKHLLQRIEDLPNSLRKEVLDFIEYLLSKHQPSAKKKASKAPARFKWQGILKGKYKNTTSVELQHKIWD